MKDEKPVGFILTLLFLGWLLGSPGDAEPAVESAVTSIERGGDNPSLPHDVAVPGTDAPTTPGSGAPPIPTAPETSSNDVATVAPFTPDAAVRHPTAPAADTSVCPCGGSNRGVCHCLARGVTCKCKPGVGSEWEMADGRPVKKTGRYLDPRTPLTQPMLVVTVGKDDTQPTKRTDGRYWFKRPDGRWCGVLELTDGATYTSGSYQFVYRDGRMVSQSPPAKTGRWERRCFGGYCRMVWVEQ